MIDVAERDLKTLLALLDKHVPECEVRAFGSRVTWTAKDHSDIDLVIVGSEKLKRGRLDDLKEALAESSIPFSVDVMDWHKISAEFQKNISKSFAVIKKPAVRQKSNWKYYKVSEFAEVVGGGTPKTSVAEYWNGDIPWITPKDLSSHKARYIAKGERNISREGLKNSSAQVVPPDTVLLTSRAPVGYLAIAKNEVTTNQGFRSLVVRKDFSSEFVYYLLLNNVDYLKQHASGSTFQELSGGTLKNLEFQIPDHATQQEIAKILGDLDAKIELNHQMNKTLEAMAQALFKEWFVDFKFPGHEKVKLVDGLPEGWRNGTVRECCIEVKNGGTPRRDQQHFWGGGNIPWLTSGEVRQAIITTTDNFITDEGMKASSAKWVEAFSTVVALYGATAGQVSLISTRLTTNQAVCSLTPRAHFSFYNYLWMRNLVKDLENKAVGSAQQNISKAIVEETFTLIPVDMVLRRFDEVVRQIFSRLVLNIDESKSLVGIRDSLLPKLMSGKIRGETYAN
jgi:type I restriction enzyme S subunit